MCTNLIYRIYSNKRPPSNIRPTAINAHSNLLRLNTPFQ